MGPIAARLAADGQREGGCGRLGRAPPHHAAGDSIIGEVEKIYLHAKSVTVPQSGLALRHAVIPSRAQPPGIGVAVGVALGIGSLRHVQPKTVTPTPSVTEPLSASSLPVTFAPTPTEIDAGAIMLPRKILFPPRVAEPPSTQKTLQGLA